MTGLLIAAGNRKAADTLLSLLRPFHPARSLITESGADARRRAGELPLSLIVIHAPLADEPADRLAMDLAAQSGAMTLLIVRQEDAAETAARVADSGVAVIGRPFQREAFLQLLRALMAAQARVERMQEENRKLSARLEEARLVGRAKCALIRYRGLTEEEAQAAPVCRQPSTAPRPSAQLRTAASANEPSVSCTRRT